MDNPKLRDISYEELHLMMTRLVLKVQEDPALFEGWENGNVDKGVTDFIKGEDFRRGILIQETIKQPEVDLFENVNDEDIVLDLPSGGQAVLMSKKSYLEQRLSMGSVGSNPVPGDYNNWSILALKDSSTYDNLEDEDKIFIMNKSLEIYGG